MKTGGWLLLMMIMLAIMVATSQAFSLGDHLKKHLRKFAEGVKHVIHKIRDAFHPHKGKKP